LGLEELFDGSDDPRVVRNDSGVEPRAITLPFPSITNFSKFQTMSPVLPHSSATCTSSSYSSCRPEPLTSIFSVIGKVAAYVVEQN